MPQIEPGNVLMDFFKGSDGEWKVLWHSNIVDYAKIKEIVAAHDQPAPLITAVKDAGFNIEAIFDEDDAIH